MCLMVMADGIFGKVQEHHIKILWFGETVSRFVMISYFQIFNTIEIIWVFFTFFF